jgi:hypothetical protein
MQFQRIFVMSLTFGFVLALGACSDDSTGESFSGTGGTGGMIGSGGTTGTGASSGIGGTGGGAAGSGTGGASGGCFVAICPDGNPYGCGDCMDNDGDGVIDDKDPECLGPCDDTEGPVLLTGTPGETGAQCGADCYFDRGNGSGSGECQWDRRCDELDPKDGCSYPPPSNVNTNICLADQPEGCEETCGQLTPNGCDCFGCCTFPELNGEYVFLGSFIDNEGTCTLAALTDTINDPPLCRPCTPAGNCLNECGRCELCLGKTEIPEDCFPGTGGTSGTGGSGGGDLRCPVGKQVCGLPGDPACPAGSFCLTGCCTEIVVQ